MKLEKGLTNQGWVAWSLILGEHTGSMELLLSTPNALLCGVSHMVPLPEWLALCFPCLME